VLDVIGNHRDKPCFLLPQDLKHIKGIKYVSKQSIILAVNSHKKCMKSTKEPAIPKMGKRSSQGSLEDLTFNLDA
jgi:hypothetical protein